MNNSKNKTKSAPRQQKQAQGKPADKKPRAKREINRDNLNTALWLWFFPVGLSKLWRARCTWPRAVKVGITAAMAAILLAVFILSTPGSRKPVTGVELVSGNPEVEVYGPALPAVVLTGYTQESPGSIIVDHVDTDVHYVYAADGARCYHEYECKFAFASSQRLTVYEAYYLGFEPCGKCKPPVYTPGETDPITAQPIGATQTAQQSAESETGDGAGT